MTWLLAVANLRVRRRFCYLTPMSPTFTLSALAVLLVFGLIIYFIFRPKRLPPLPAFRAEWRNTLLKYVSFYQKLEPADRQRFEARMQSFLQGVKLTGIETEIGEQDRAFIAASAIIPTFGFPRWNQYPKLEQVLLYKTHFRWGDFATEGNDRRVAGMVGGGFLNGKLLLSRPSLHRGFKVEGPDNTGIHEFTHLLDKADGETDGIPDYFLENDHLIPWVEMIRKESIAIAKGDSKIDSYALTNQAEFFAVAAEYFFNQPYKLNRDHPILFSLLERVFQQDMNNDGKIG